MILSYIKLINVEHKLITLNAQQILLIPSPFQKHPGAQQATPTTVKRPFPGRKAKGLAVDYPPHQATTLKRIQLYV